MKGLSLYLAFGVAVLGSALTAQADIVDQVLATVNTEVILQSDVMAEIAPYLNELRQTTTNQEEFNKAAEEKLRATLEQAVDNKILLREALLADVKVDDADVEKQLEDIRKLYASNEEFLKELDNAGETLSDLRERIKKQFLARRMAYFKHTEFEKEAVISESDVAQYYEDHKDEFSKAERVRCRQIFLAAGSNKDERAKVKAQLEGILTEIQGGADFAELAKKHSQAPGAEDGGLIGWVVRNDLKPSLDEAAFTLADGQISGILETDGGFHILKVELKEAAGLAPLDEVRNEIEPLLRAKIADERYNKWIKELRKRSRVRIFM